MPQQLFHAGESRAVVEHGAGKRVAQHVRTELGGSAHLHQGGVHNAINERGIERLAVVFDEKRSASFAQIAVAQLAVKFYPAAQLGAKGHNAVFVALAMHAQLALSGVDPRVEQPNQLGTANACGVEHEHHQAVAHGAKIVHIDRECQQVVH